MKTPAFWYRSKGWNWRSDLFLPLGKLYAFATARRVARPASFRAQIPVICIGNINAGGTGKTPTTIALLQRLNARGLKPHVVTKGHGGEEIGPHRVNPRQDTAARVGDEPLLLAAFGPTWVAKNRAEGARAAQAAGAQLILMDDGFQNPEIHKDFSIVVVDAQKGFGNRRCIPAGPLREPVEKGLSRADLLLSIGDENAQALFQDHLATAPAIARQKACLVPLRTGMHWEDTRAVAFAGIGHPEKFFATLRGLGVDLVAEHALEDHQPLTSTLLARLEKDALRLNAQLITTEKDAVRLPKAFLPKVISLPVRLEIEDWSEIDSAVDALLTEGSN